MNTNSHRHVLRTHVLTRSPSPPPSTPSCLPACLLAFFPPRAVPGVASVQLELLALLRGLGAVGLRRRERPLLAARQRHHPRLAGPAPLLLSSSLCFCRAASRTCCALSCSVLLFAQSAAAPRSLVCSRSVHSLALSLSLVMSHALNVSSRSSAPPLLLILG
eukprot:1263511-Rhodomonas_salina.1